MQLELIKKKCVDFYMHFATLGGLHYRVITQLIFSLPHRVCFCATGAIFKQCVYESGCCLSLLHIHTTITSKTNRKVIAPTD